MKTSFILTAYLIYLPVALLLTWYVARTLFNSGKIFMMDIFNGREDLAGSTNKLFEVGFYLLNLGFALLILRIGHELTSNQSMIEALSRKVGGYSIYLGIMLFMNMLLFFRGKRISKERKRLALLIKQTNQDVKGMAE